MFSGKELKIQKNEIASMNDSRLDNNYEKNMNNVSIYNALP